MATPKELLEQRQALQEVKINKMLVEDILYANYNAEVLVSCVLEKLEKLEMAIKSTNANLFTTQLIKETRQLVLIIEQERAHSYNRIGTLITQIDNS